MTDSIGYSDSWNPYNDLDTSAFNHFRINHSKLFAEDRNFIKGIENVKEPSEAAPVTFQWHSQASFSALSRGV